MAEQSHSASSARYYRAFGLQISSEIALPELASSPAPARSEADLSIRIGSIPDPATPGRDVCPDVTLFDGGLLVDVEPARYFISAGRDIVVEPKTATMSRDIRGYLLGSALGAALHQRSLLPLHANAIVGPAGAVAFAGPSGAGKSTLAAYLLGQGYRVQSDDVSVVTPAPDGPAVQPGVARIKLWNDALIGLGRTEGGLERIWEGEDKYSLPLPTDVAEPATLKRIVVLSRAPSDKQLELERLTGPRAVAAVVANIYRWEFAVALGGAGALFAKVIELCRFCDVTVLTLPDGFEALRRKQFELDQLLSC
jgi:hypothetical protein